MKSYTDLEQSHKLAEILPIESADMWYGNEDPHKITVGKWNNDKHDEDDIPCWSLAALLNYLREIDYFPEIVVDKDEVSMHYYYDESIGNVSKIFAEAENFIDACYEMILKLHEL